jgi:carboxyl-terminal processing protease
LRNLTGDGLLLHAGRFDVSNMKPGDSRTVAFTFDVLDELQESFVNFELSVTDRDLRVGSSEKVKLPLTKSPLSLVKTQGKVALQSVAGVRGQPLGAAPVVGELDKGAVVEKAATFGPYTKVNLGDDRFGFVETKALKDGAAGAVKLTFKPLLSHSPPQLDVTPAKLAVKDAKVHIEGQATDSDKVLDAFIFVGARKVFYQSNRKADDQTKLKFSLDADLQPGINVITVVARESEDTTSRYTMIVRRDGPNGEALKTTRGETMGDDLGLDSEE